MAARVNKTLIEWQVGELVDEEFVLKLKNEISKYDPSAAKLLYILFKQKIHGSEISDEEYLESIIPIYKHIQSISNMTLELFELPEVLEARTNFQKAGYIENLAAGGNGASKNNLVSQKTNFA